MKYLKPALTIAVLLCFAASSGAWAQHSHGGGHVGGGHFVAGHGGFHGGGHWRGGVFIDAPLFWPGWYGPSYYDPFYYPGYYYSPPLVVDSGPPTYVERGAPAPQSSQSS